MVHWDCVLRTAISDIEVSHVAMLNQVLDVVANVSLFTVESCLLFVG